jgi:hypothetical protein
LGRAALTNVAAPALTSEAAGQLTAGTPYEKAARIAGAFGGGFGATRAANALADARALKNATIPLQDLKTQTGANYDAIRDANVGKALPPDALNETADQLTQALNAKNQRPINAPELHAVVNQLRNPATEGAPDVADLLAARAAFKDQIGANPAGAFIALDKIGKAIDKFSPGTMDALRAQDQNYSAFKTGEALDKNIARAEDTAAGANSGLNLGNRIRQRAIALKNSSQWGYMNDAQKAEVQGVIDGTTPQEIFRHAANLLGKGHGLGGLVGGEALGHLFGNDLLGMAVGLGVGRGANSLYANSVSRGAEAASDAIRRGSPMGQQFAQDRLYVSPNNSLKAGLRSAAIERRRAALAGLPPAALAAIYSANKEPDKNR